MTQTKSYADFGLSRSWRQFAYAMNERQRAEENMRILFSMLQEQEARIERKLSRPVANLRILEIGPGQGMERARYFGLRNDVLGIDLDVIPQGFHPGDYWRMLRKNGTGRFLKTVGRKLILGGTNEAAWEKAVGSRNMSPPQLVHGDVCQPLDGALGQFDVVMTWSVFEHLPDPEQALQNVIDMLRPGGVFYISLHLFTAHNGHHDIRAFTGREDELPLWGHLRPAQRELIHPSSYLNEWRLADWRALFNRLTPDADEFLEAYDVAQVYGPQLTPQIRAELAGYTDEELYTVDAVYLWRKEPDAAQKQ